MADRAVPDLTARDFTATSEFSGRFGFVEAFRDDAWLILRRGGLQLEFFPYPELDARTRSFKCRIRVADRSHPSHTGRANSAGETDYPLSNNCAAETACDHGA